MIVVSHKLFSATIASRRAAFSLIEVLIAVTLMSVIVLGLMAMFGETQRAFRTGINQVDIMEGGRSAMDLIAREVEQAQSSDITNYANFLVRQSVSVPFPYDLSQSLPGSGQLRSNVMQEVWFATREGQRWSGIGYSVYYTNWIGTLLRYETNVSQIAFGGSPQIINAAFAARPSKIIDNVVSFRVNVFDLLGRRITRTYNFDYPNFQLDGRLVDLVNIPVLAGDVVNCAFYSNAIPAYVEIELAVLDPKVAGRARTLGEDSLNSQRRYLEKQAGSVQVFRRRVPIRNVDPSVYQ